MPTAAQLSENSHQGFDGIKAALCLGSMEAKSNTASGMPVCLWREGIGSRSSGKERDAETGLDYFGARYYSGALGRFTSVDPMGLSDRHIANPQKWNKYTYVINNPLTRIDPDGLDDFFVFRPLATSTERTWSAIQSIAPQYGHTVTIYNGSEASVANYKTALQKEGSHVIAAAHVNSYQDIPNGVLLDDGGVGDPSYTTKSGDLLDPVGDVQSTSVTILGCNSDALSSQYPDVTFTGTRPKTNTIAQDAGAATFTDALDESGNPHPTGGVIGTGYAGPEWEWP